MPEDSTQSRQGLLPSVIGWISHPFSTSGSALNWVLFVGLLIVAAWFWNYVLLKLLDER
jgi:hypothetical protein